MNLSTPTQAILWAALREELLSLNHHLDQIRSQLKTPFNASTESAEERLALAQTPGLIRSRIRKLEELILDPTSDPPEALFILSEWRKRLLWLPHEKSVQELTQQCEAAMQELKETV